MQIETRTRNHGKGYIRMTKGAWGGDLDELEFVLVLKTLARLPKAEFHGRKSSGKEHHQDNVLLETGTCGGHRSRRGNQFRFSRFLFPALSGRIVTKIFI